MRVTPQRSGQVRRGIVFALRCLFGLDGENGVARSRARQSGRVFPGGSDVYANVEASDEPEMEWWFRLLSWRRVRISGLSRSRESSASAYRTESRRIAGPFQLPFEQAVTGMGKSNRPLNAREFHGRHQSRSIPRAMALQPLFQCVVRTKSNVVAGVVVRHVEVNNVDHVPLHGLDCPRPAGHAAAERSRTMGRRLQLIDAPSSLTARTA